MAERDPRVDPMAGDVLSPDKGWEHSVIGYVHGRVLYTTRCGGQQLNSTCRMPIDEWRQMCGRNNSVVIRRAEDGTTGKDGE